MMVRINLLPGKKKSRASEAGSQLVILLVVLLVAEAVFLYWMHSEKSAEIDGKNATLAERQAEIASLTKQKAAIPNLQRRIEELRQAETVLERLAVLRTGPHHPLDELVRILNRPNGSAEKQRAKLDGWDPNWAAENVYLTLVEEEGDGYVIVQGRARSDGDVAQFLLRLNTAKTLFDEIDLRYTRAVRVDIEGRPLVMKEFELTMRVNFFYRTKDGIDFLNRNKPPEEGGPPAAGQPNN